MIYLIITTTLINKYGIIDSELRKNQYISAISNTLKFLPEGIKPIIVENSGLSNSFLDNFGIDVVYTNNNSQTFKHKGVNELLDLKEVILKYNILDDDTIIKITGRYTVFSDYFFKLVTENFEKDLIMKFYNCCTFKYVYFDCILGLFAIKCKYLKNFNFNSSTKISIEVEYAIYLRKNIKKSNIIEVNNLDLEVCFAGNNKVFKY